MFRNDFLKLYLIFGASQVSMVAVLSQPITNDYWMELTCTFLYILVYLWDTLAHRGECNKSCYLFDHVIL